MTPLGWMVGVRGQVFVAEHRDLEDVARPDGVLRGGAWAWGPGGAPVTAAWGVLVAGTSTIASRSAARIVAIASPMCRRARRPPAR